MASNPTIEKAMAAAIGHHNAGRLHEAELLYRQVLQAVPRHHGAMHNLGELAYRVGQFDIALQLVQNAIKLHGKDPNYYNTLSVILRAMGRLEEAFEVCKGVLALDMNSSNVHANLAICHAQRGDLPASIASFQRAIQLDPQNANAHDGLGLSLLMSGQLQRGWAEQEWRWRKRVFERQRFPNSPHWDGADIPGKTLLIYIEQGYGDMFQLCRYVPLLAERGVKVVLETVPDIADLMGTLAGDAQLIIAGHTPPPFDMACPMMSVPYRFGTTLQTTPATVPYLRADARRMQDWAQCFAADRGLKVGIAWAGRPTHADDRNRSMTLASFAPLANIPGVTFYSLQKGDAAAQVHTPPAGMKLIDLSDRLTDFNDTAAAIANLDLVISVDTAVVHLAGALARPVWTLLPFCPDWRWMLHRADSPWYPTMRLFRAPKRGDWPAVMHEVKKSLENEAGRSTMKQT